MITDTLSEKNDFFLNYDEALAVQGLGNRIHILSVNLNRVANSPRRVIMMQYTIARGTEVVLIVAYPEFGTDPSWYSQRPI